MDFAQVYEDYYDRIYKYVFSILLNREDTEDVVGNTFVAAYTVWESYDPQKASVSTWLMRIAHNKAIDLLRSAERSKRSEMPEYYVVPDTSDSHEEAYEDKESVLYLYSKLDAGEREFLNMRYAIGMKDSEVADLLGLPVKTVNKRYQRLLARCRQMLEEHQQTADGSPEQSGK